MRHRGIDRKTPQGNEQQKGPEVHAPDHRPGDERRGDDGKHALKGRKGEVRHGGGIIALGRVAHALEAHPGQAAHQRPAGHKGQGVTYQHPDDGGHAQRTDGHHQGVEHVPPADQSAVEKGQSGRHEKHQRSGNQQPRGIPG